ncbi:MAG: nitroreductase [Pseudoxanthomonas sp.]
MDIVEAVESRRSVRAFLDRPVDPDVLRRVVERAARAPSGGNLQPWHVDVVIGDAMNRLKAVMRERLTQAPDGEEPEYAVYPSGLVSPYRDRRFEVGEAIYARLGVPREDKVARRAWFARNFQFFGATAALFVSVDRRMGLPQWSDLGMYLQTAMLLLRGEGLHSCAQECWAMYPKTISAFIGLPPERMLFAGLAIGRADPDHPLDGFRASRASTECFVRFHGASIGTS